MGKGELYFDATTSRLIFPKIAQNSTRPTDVFAVHRQVALYCVSPQAEREWSWVESAGKPDSLVLPWLCHFRIMVL